MVDLNDRTNASLEHTTVIETRSAVTLMVDFYVAVPLDTLG